MLQANQNQARNFLKKPLKKGTVAIIGDFALDRYEFGSVERISPEAPVPILSIEKSFLKAGCAANVAANVAELQKSWDLNLKIYGVLGKDETAKSIKKLFEEMSPKLQMQFVEDPQRITPLKTRYIAGSQHQLLRVDQESSSPLSSELENEFLKNLDTFLTGVDVLVVQDYAKGLLTPKLFAKIFEICRSKKIFSIVDPNINTARENYQGADLITPNINEAESLLGSKKLLKGKDNSIVESGLTELKNLLKIPNIMITRSQYGLSLLDSNNQKYHFPTLAKAVFDVTGAGDTVVATFASAIAAGADLSVACTLAIAASGVVVSKVGTATASTQEIDDALGSL
jgi:rfaE bifunctional protein kinase chain/domain